MSALDLDAIEARAKAALEDVPDPHARGWRAGAVDKPRVFVPYADAFEGPNGERVLLRMNEHLPYEKAVAHIAGAHPAAVLALCARVRELEEARSIALDMLRRMAAEYGARTRKGMDPYIDRAIAALTEKL